MVTPRFYPEMGGIETHVYEVSRRLAADGCDVTVLTTDRFRQNLPFEAINGFRVVRVPAWPSRRDYYFAPDIYRHVRDSEADLLHVQGYHTFVPPVALAAARRRRLPFVITFHSGGHSSWLRNAVRLPQHRLLAPLVRHAAHLIGVSQHEAAFFSDRMGIPRERFTVIRNGAQMPQIDLPQAVNTPLIVSVGRLEKYKGHHRLLAAMPHLRAALPDVRVRILGEGPYKSQLIAMAARLGVTEAVTIGGIPPADRAGVATLLKQAAVVVLLSDYEAHPVAVMEALALGRRVVVCEGSGLTEMVDGDAVASVPRQAPPIDVGNAILAQLAKGPLSGAMTLPTWDDCAAEVRNVYTQVLRRAKLAL